MKARTQYDVFVSYRRTASESAGLVVEKLRSMGYSVAAGMDMFDLAMKKLAGYLLSRPFADIINLLKRLDAEEERELWELEKLAAHP